MSEKNELIQQVSSLKAKVREGKGRFMTDGALVAAGAGAAGVLDGALAMRGMAPAAGMAGVAAIAAGYIMDMPALFLLGTGMLTPQIHSAGAAVGGGLFAPSPAK